MTVVEAEAWIDLARRKGVVEVHVGDARFRLGPLPAEPRQPPAKAEEEPDRPHPADLVANPPELGLTPESEADF